MESDTRRKNGPFMWNLLQRHDNSSLITVRKQTHSTEMSAIRWHMFNNQHSRKVCDVCQLPWYKYFHYGLLQATKMTWELELAPTPWVLASSGKKGHKLLPVFQDVSHHSYPQYFFIIWWSLLFSIFTAQYQKLNQEYTIFFFSLQENFWRKTWLRKLLEVRNAKWEVKEQMLKWRRGKPILNTQFNWVKY